MYISNQYNTNHFKIEIMKKLLFALFAFSSLAVSAQEETLKAEVDYLPKAGDYSIGIDATPIISYIGNMFGGYTGSNTIGGLTTSGKRGAITGKIMIDDNTAYRGSFKFNITSETSQGEQQQFEAAKTKTVTDIQIGAGIEKRKGSGKLQAVYGAIGYVGFGSNSDNYDYEESIKDLAPDLPIKETSGFQFGLGAGVFGGVEYFFMPKISVGAEFGINAYISPSSSAKYIYTEENKNNGTIQEGKETEVKGSSSYGIVTNPNAVINLNFYF